MSWIRILEIFILSYFAAINLVYGTFTVIAFLDLIRGNGYAVSDRPVPERGCPELTCDATAVAENGERFVVWGQDAHEAVCELAGQVGIDLADG